MCVPFTNECPRGTGARGTPDRGRNPASALRAPAWSGGAAYTGPVTHDPIDDVQRDAIRRLARQYGWQLVVLFGSVAEHGRGRDVDLAVLPSGPVDLMTQGRWQASLESIFAPGAVDLLLLGDETSPIARFEVFRAGLCLYESQEGVFDRELDRAFFLYADSEKFRRASREVLRG